jgi:hypothetical protein
MDLSTREYDITPKPAEGQTARQRWRMRCAQLVLIFLLALSLQWLADTFVFPRVRRGWVDLLIMPVMVTLALTFSLFRLFRRKISIVLTVGEDFVERRTDIGSRILNKRISRLRVRSIDETTLRPGTSYATRGLAVRDRGAFGTGMLGYIFIPETIPDYDEVRNRLTGWISK